jgi:hypothetical protein
MVVQMVHLNTSNPFGHLMSDPQTIQFPVAKSLLALCGCVLADLKVWLGNTAPVSGTSALDGWPLAGFCHCFLPPKKEVRGWLTDRECRERRSKDGDGCISDSDGLVWPRTPETGSLKRCGSDGGGSRLLL